MTEQALISLEEIEALYAKEAEEAEKGITYSGTTISTKGKQFTLPNGRKSPGPLTGIILDFRNANAKYDGVWNPNKPNKPSCWAIGPASVKHTSLTPSPDVAKPCGAHCGEVKNWQKLPSDEQQRLIKEEGICPFAQWGSDPQYGRGKACKSQILLAIVSETDLTPETDPWLLKVNRSSLKNFASFQSRVKQGLDKHVAQVAVDISFDPNFDYPVLVFHGERLHKHMQTVFALRSASTALLESAMDYTDD